MRLQLWSYNYAPEPIGIAPLSRALALALTARGHDVLVVAAHPHYPAPCWGHRLTPYRERREGVPVLRLPIWPGRTTLRQRLRQETSFAAGQALIAPLLPSADAIIAVSPSFPALIPVMAAARARRTPWVLWLQDVLPDGAEATGLLSGGPVLRAARTLELAAYRSASRIVAISETFRANLVAKGVPDAKIATLLNPSTRPPVARAIGGENGTARVLSMGNIGLSQGLPRFVRAFEDSAALEGVAARLVIAGDGVEAPAVRSAASGRRVEVMGLLSQAELDHELGRAALGVVTQRPELTEFNVPSKLMNYLAWGVPVVAAVRTDSEVAAIVRSSGAGWVTDAGVPEAFPEAVSHALSDRAELSRRGAAGRRFAEDRLTPAHVAERFEDVLLEAVTRSR